jgi:hypothetical protein
MRCSALTALDADPAITRRIAACRASVPVMLAAVRARLVTAFSTAEVRSTTAAADGPEGE